MNKQGINVITIKIVSIIIILSILTFTFLKISILTINVTKHKINATVPVIIEKGYMFGYKWRS